MPLKNGSNRPLAIMDSKVHVRNQGYQELLHMEYEEQIYKTSWMAIVQSNPVDQYTLQTWKVRDLTQGRKQ